MAKAKPDSAKRIFFTKDDTALPLPNLISHQKDSWRDFVETGLSEIFAELNPIDDYTVVKNYHYVLLVIHSTTQRSANLMPKKTI